MLLSELVEELAGIVSGLEPERLAGEEAARLAGLFDRAERLCSAGKAIAAERAAACGQWRVAGYRSPEEWLSRLSGTSKATARATLGAGQLAASNDAMGQALRAGELSGAQAGEIATAAPSGAPGTPQAVEQLLEEAKRRGFEGLRQQARRVAMATSGPEEDLARHEALRRSRYLRTWSDRDGAGRIDARLAPEDLASFLSFLTPYEREVIDDARRQARREPFEAYRADALMAMAAASAQAAPGSAGAGPDPSSEARDAPEAPEAPDARKEGPCSPGAWPEPGEAWPEPQPPVAEPLLKEPACPGPSGPSPKVPEDRTSAADSHRSGRNMAAEQGK